jgi:preprotein translocase subunit SecB
MRISPIRLERYYFEELAFRHDEAFDAESDSASTPLPVDELQASLDFGHEKGNVRHRFYRLKLELPPLDGRFSCSFRVVAVGFFVIDDTCPADQINTIANTNAPAVLYGVAREAIAALTGRGPLSPLCLPAVHFLDFAQSMEQETAAAQSEQPKKSTAKSKAPRQPRKKAAKTASPRP